MICEFKEKMSSVGFLVGTPEVKNIACKIANERGVPFSDGIPSDEWVSSFRARNRYLRYRLVRPKDIAKIHAEHPDHVRTLESVLKEIERQNPGIMDAGNAIINFDETESMQRCQVRRLFVPHHLRRDIPAHR